MNHKLEHFLNQIFPFLLVGVAIALLIGLLIMFSYVLLWGVLIGGLLWLVNGIKNYFIKRPEAKSNGKIIEHDDHLNQ